MFRKVVVKHAASLSFGWRCTQHVALLIPESRRVVTGFLIKSDHCNSPGRLAEYKRQFQRVVRRPRDDPSIFAIELETLARRKFIDIDISISATDGT